MRRHLFIILFIASITYSYGQPCKSVKQGMTKLEVLKLAGEPTEMDTIPEFDEDNGELKVVWQYGDPMNYGNQRVEFTGDIVDKEVIADGKKYDELLFAFQRGELTEQELFARIKILNKEACK